MVGGDPRDFQDTLAPASFLRIPWSANFSKKIPRSGR